MQSLRSILSAEKRSYIDDTIEVVSGYNFSTYQTIKKIHLYDNSQFLSKEGDRQMKRIFANITSYRRDAIARLMDIDTANLRVYENNPMSRFAAPLCEYEFKQFLVKNNFADLLNQMANDLVTYGSIILRYTTDRPELVDLRKVFFDPTCETIKNSRFVIIKHDLTIEELRDKVSLGWDKDKIEMIIRKVRQGGAKESYEDVDGNANTINSTATIEVYERWGYAPKGLLKNEFADEDDERVLMYSVIADPDLYVNQGEKKYQSETLFVGEWKKELPFEDAHFTKTKGRWLGIGIYEAMFPIQERYNELVNQKRLSMQISTMHLFQTADPTILSNVLSDVQNGMILKTKSPNGITPVVNEERNLSAFETEKNEFISLGDKISFANDFLTGGGVPSSTPATNAVLLTNNTSKVTLFKRQAYSNMLRRFFKNFIFPQFIKELDKETVIRFVGESKYIEEIDEIETTNKVNEIMFNASPEDTNQVFQSMVANEVKKTLNKYGNVRYVKRLKEYYLDKQFDFDLIIDNEQEDIAILADNTFKYIVTLAQNPMLLQDPVSKELMLSYGKKIGMKTDRLELAMQKQALEQPQQMQPQQQARIPMQARPTTRDENARVL